MAKQWKQYSGIWTPTQQAQALAAGTWTGITQYSLWIAGYGLYGQTAQDNTINQSSPVQIGSAGDWQNNVFPYSGNSVVVKQTGYYSGWGLNIYGDLGNNEAVNLSSPIQISGSENWSDTTFIGSTGSSYIKSDGTLWTWGNNSYGECGHGDTIPRSSPVQVGALTNWSIYKINASSALAIKTDGTLWACGYNLYGQSGNNQSGATAHRSSPIQVGSDTNWYSVSLDNMESMGVKTDDTLWVWGRSLDGSLGLNENINRSSPVQLGSITDWASIYPGYSFMGIKYDGTLWTWGRNNNGQLGHNTLIPVSSPVQVGALTNWGQLTSSRNSNFMASIKTDGTAWTWGANNVGALGQNDGVNRSSPVQVGSRTDYVDVVCLSNNIVFRTESTT